MGSNQNDFVLDSKGRCFLCLDKIPVVNYEPGSEPLFPKYSLYYLSRYLKMDLRKVFKDTEQIPSHLLSKVENSRLKVELCEECVLWSEQFSENYRKLEKAEMELGSCLRRIHSRLLVASEGVKTEKFKKLTNVESHLTLSKDKELEILEVLREEAFQKSHHKLRADAPRVKFHKLSRKQIRTEQLKFKPRIDIADQPKSPVLAQYMTEDSPKLDLKASDSQLKLEAQNSLSEDDNSSSDNWNVDNEHMSQDFEDTTLMIEEDNINATGSGSGVVVAGISVAKIQSKSKTTFGSDRRVWDVNPKTGKYKCHICSMEFANRARARHHYESVHLKFRFKCVTCGKQFSQRGTCSRHQKSAHAGIRYACQVCKKSFTQTGHVRHHQRTTDCGMQLGLK